VFLALHLNKVSQAIGRIPQYSVDDSTGIVVSIPISLVGEGQHFPGQSNCFQEIFVKRSGHRLVAFVSPMFGQQGALRTVCHTFQCADRAGRSGNPERLVRNRGHLSRETVSVRCLTRGLFVLIEKTIERSSPDAEQLRRLQLVPAGLDEGGLDRLEV